MYIAIGLFIYRGVSYLRIYGWMDGWMDGKQLDIGGERQGGMEISCCPWDGR